jgi:LuxR family transcriptional regulator, maltose regulon positive regulatory protein
MAHPTPHVEQGTLTLSERDAEHRIAVGSPAWFTWLETATAFTFASSHGTFTARRERSSSRRGDWYWRAYQHRAGTRRRAYLGKAAELSLERLQTVAAQLAEAGVLEQPPDRTGAGRDAPLAASLSQQALLSGTVTFLFTDIVGSTQLWEQHHEAMGTALARHDALMRQAVAAHGGVVFKTVGDSVHAVFARAGDALATALAAQRALAAEPWGETGPLLIRMALHSGAAELREDDYFGPPLNRAARILALGHGGQILLSRTTHDLVADELPARTSLRALGDYHLKDLNRPEPIFQCVSADLPADFPPLRSDNPRPSTSVPAPQLLATKLYRPRARPDLVVRPRLFARLDAGLQGMLTLVCAPAGFGKTTLLAAWLRRTERPAAWLGLDAEDSDPTVFLRYLVAALQTLAPEVGATLLTLLQSPPPPLETLLIALLNDLAMLPQNSILVLDDYHVLEAPPIHQAVSFLLDHLPPVLHLVIATREDPPLPLARLRARGQVAELRAEQLRFTADEAAVFLTDVMGLPLSTAEVAALETRTEGWIAGLQFAALAMHDRDDYAGFIAAFTGSNRFVVDYLADEVLSRQPAHIQTFLLQTSILDPMCGPLCDAILLGRTESGHPHGQPRTLEDNLGSQFSVLSSGDSHSQLLLEQLERANLFVTPLDAERRWYRYHHLFAEVLRERLRRGASTTELVTLHRRASAWYEQASLISQAVQHALAGRAFGQAAALVEQVAPAMIQHTELAKLLTWLGALPADVVQARPLLGLYYAWGLFLSGQMKQAATHLEAIEAVLATDEAKQTPEVQGHAAAMRAYLVRETGDLAATIALSRHALAHLPEQDSLLRAMVILNLAIAHYLLGEFDLASQLLTEIIADGQTPQRMANTLSALYLNTLVLRAQGALQQAFQLCQNGLELVARSGWQNFPAVGFLYVAFGDLLREHNELRMAAEYLEKGINLGQEGGHPHILIIGHVWLAWLRQTQGDVAGSHEAIGAALQLVRQHQVSPFWPLPSAACYQARLWIAQGNLAAASHWGQTSRLNQAGTPGAYLYEVEDVTLARLLIAQGNLEAAEARLLQLHHTAASAQRSGSLIEILILQAMTCAAQKRGEAALSALAQALSLAEREGFVRLFLDEGAPMARLLQAAQTRGIAPEYVETLLAAFAKDEGARMRDERAAAPLHPSSFIPQSLVEPLTSRELEVLQLLADGSSNSEIAQSLIISLGTTKKHIANIFGKLAAQSRTQAVARARALKLL